MIHDDRPSGMGAGSINAHATLGRTEPITQLAIWPISQIPAKYLNFNPGQSPSPCAQGHWRSAVIVSIAILQSHQWLAQAP